MLDTTFLLAAVVGGLIIWMSSAPRMKCAGKFAPRHWPILGQSPSASLLTIGRGSHRTYHHVGATYEFITQFETMPDLILKYNKLNGLPLLIRRHHASCLWLACALTKIETLRVLPSLYHIGFSGTHLRAVCTAQGSKSVGQSESSHLVLFSAAR